MNSFGQRLPHVRISPQCIANATVALCLACAPLAAAQDRCGQYAQRAVEQFQIMTSHPNCVIPPSLRWQNNFQNFYQSCRILPEFLLQSEEKARDEHLINCGAIQESDTADGRARAEKDASSSLAEILERPAASVDDTNALVGLIMCEANGCDNKNQGTWIFKGAKGVGRWPQGHIAKLTIVRLDGDDLAVRREDTPDSASPGYVAIYEGKRHGDRVDGQIQAVWPGHLPNSKPPGTQTAVFYATIPQTHCDPNDNGTLQDAIEVAQVATRFRQPESAFQCFVIAANQGNAQAKGVVGLMYRDGIGTVKSSEEALKWLHAGADMRDFNSELTLADMFENGLGVAPDPVEAQHWRERAQHNPTYLQQQAVAQQQQNMQQMALMGMAALVKAMSTPDVVIYRSGW